MTQQQNGATRRGVLKTAGIAGATLAGLTGIVGARGNGNGRGGGNPRDFGLTYARRINGTGSDGTYVTAHPGVQFSNPTTMLPAHRFEVENVDSGGVLEVSVESTKRTEAKGAILDINGPLGHIYDNPHFAIQAWIGGGNFVPLDYSTSGDESIYVGNYLDEYRVTAFTGGSEIDSTSLHIVPIGHPMEYDWEIKDETLEYGWNAGGLPGAFDDIRTFSHIVSDPDAPAASTSYDSATNRYEASVDVNQIDSGTQSVRMTLYEDSTGFRIISFPGTVTIP